MSFDERSIPCMCRARWGSWYQTIDSVCIRVDLSSHTKSKEVQCQITPGSIKVVVKGEELISGKLLQKVIVDDSVWTLEDNTHVQILLQKVHRTAENGWRSLLQGQYEADPATFDGMEKKLTLERFQRENPGFDFSQAEMTGAYHNGGPKLPGS